MFFKNKASTYKWLIVGLGNPGAQYEETRHNAGFMAIDLLSKKIGCDFKKQKFDALLADGKISDTRVLLAKPQTYMNNSGKSVSKIAAFYKIPFENILIIFDDVSLDIGKIRLRKSGSHGGHKGMQDISALCGTNNIKRIKIGVGAKPNADYDMKDWVLGKIPKEDFSVFETALEKAVLSAEETVLRGIENAMNKFNG